jgi:hypothetical protein
MYREESQEPSMGIKTVTAALSLVAGGLLLVGCSSGSQPPAQPAQTIQPAVTSTPPPSGPPVSINAEMVSIVDHAGHALWDTEREGKAPKTQQDWELVAEHAIQIAAAGTLITLPGTGPNDLTLTQQADWKKWARAMSDSGLAAFKASENKDIKGLVTANSQLVETCEGCHKQYKPALPSEGIVHQHLHVEPH